MIPKIPNLPAKRISIGQRLAGVGCVALGLFVIVMCLVYMGPLEGAPRNAAWFVIGFAAIMAYFGVVIGFPDYLPKKIVAGTFFLLGIACVLMGVTILIWFGYNLLVQRQPQFRPGRIGLPIAMLVVGYGFARSSWNKLRGRSED